MTAPLIRLDDFPNGHRGREPQREVLDHALRVFNTARCRYVLGVSPLLLGAGDADWLNARMGPTGSVVMHGFDHGFSWKGDWKQVKELWAEGGEFAEMSAQAIGYKWQEADKQLRAFPSYDPRHFIAPFNVYTQALLDALQTTPIDYLYGMDTISDMYGLRFLNPGKVRVVLSRDGITCGRIWDMVRCYHPDSTPITLHWLYDASCPDWRNGYEQLAKLAGGADA